MTLTLPNTYVNGNTVDADELNANESAIAARLGALGDSDLSPDAGITSKRLLDRFSPCIVPVMVVPPVSGADLTGTGASNDYSCGTATAAASGSEICRWEPEVPSGRKWYLAAISVIAQEVVDGAASEKPVFWFYHNGALIAGGKAQIDASQTTYYLRIASPYSNPFLAVQNGDYFAVRVGSSGSSNAPGVRGVTATYSFKQELMS